MEQQWNNRGRSQNYILKYDYTLQSTTSSRYGQAVHEQKTLPQGAFVRPFWDIGYVPLHVREKFKFFSPTTEVFCYTHFGVVPIPLNYILESH